MVLLIMFATSCSSESLDDNANNAQAHLVVPETKSIEVEIMELINDHRLSMGLNPLNNMNVIKAQAYSHTGYMIAQNNVSHDNFFQRKSYLVNNVGANRVSENVAYGYTSAQSVVNAWLNSDGHRENIEGNYTDFDISAEQNEEGRWYYTNIFVKK
ncbi:CAP domain-containing protein [Hanstruepera neustonica]|uniref:CAP domain-containing protein n=2 Tax=Hanstruepera neustonica TaxID=1445657 RepID=A0A2K1DWH4_9FLAO|nr:CAP domain-containing protein [Hanstruepera neustonica]